MSNGTRLARHLIVEGRTDEILFQALMRHIGLSGVQTHNIEGVDNLRDYLETLVNTPDFLDESVSLGIARDADASADSALQSVRDALQAVGLAVPPEPLVIAGDAPTTVALILPHGESSGTVEDVCLASVADDAVMPCVDEYMRCVGRHGAREPNNSSKARVQAFLSSRARPGLLLGQAANAGYWDFDHVAFNPLKDLLRIL